MRDGGCYGHVDGPRFNTKAEIRGLAAAGVTAVSQTAGPETVLAGEAELPFALVGYATDYANGVQAEPTPVERLLELIAASTGDVRAAARGGAARDRRRPRSRRPASCTASTRSDRRARGARARARPAARPSAGLARAARRRTRRAALQALLVRRAAAWAAAAAPGAAFVAVEPADAVGEVAALLPAGGVAAVRAEPARRAPTGRARRSDRARRRAARC